MKRTFISLSILTGGRGLGDRGRVGAEVLVQLKWIPILRYFGENHQAEINTTPGWSLALSPTFSPQIPFYQRGLQDVKIKHDGVATFISKPQRTSGRRKKTTTKNCFRKSAGLIYKVICFGYIWKCCMSLSLWAKPRSHLLGEMRKKCLKRGNRITTSYSSLGFTQLLSDAGRNSSHFSTSEVKV